MKNKVRVPFSPDQPLCAPKLFTISAPAGAGKTTLVRMLAQEFPNSFQKTLSLTTRSPRPEEVPGVDYRFVSQEEFKRRLDSNDFLEWVSLFGEYYGTSRLEIDEIWKSGKHAVAVIDVKGALSLKNRIPTVTVFISAPSQEELERRLKHRGSEQDSQRQERLQHSLVEQAASNQFEYVIINDDLEKSYEILKSIFIAEEHRNVL
ncbi:Guanylate kinase,guanylate kinase,Guanylate kinase,guanylate kinase,Guanylate kinase [Chlamydia poikilotherma]|uniref:Guanylate kinase n=1 Tax=Chlamydia poikilotherma TaxID=1967783 RepID=A0A3B0PMW5_9CHLA|nr:guanylate kinase [Chlamydia poikilotherma]SYX09119.1 Guanylate kinase,guanylate kinase,Guanylate kinase,guanylate kinase,Guanylate kinase [Chlamydia poikilotherma]